MINVEDLRNMKAIEKDMEQYRHLIGQLDALNFIEQELSDLLEKQENDD